LVNFSFNSFGGAREIVNATNGNAPGTLVKRDGSGNVAVGNLFTGTVQNSNSDLYVRGLNNLLFQTYNSGGNAYIGVNLIMATGYTFPTLHDLRCFHLNNAVEVSYSVATGHETTWDKDQTYGNFITFTGESTIGSASGYPVVRYVQETERLYSIVLSVDYEGYQNYTGLATGTDFFQVLIYYTTDGGNTWTELYKKKWTKSATPTDVYTNQCGNIWLACNE
jgi:hypothetical protein